MPVPFFSIVMPTFNRADLFREALDSIAAQEFQDFEVIVVDSGSTDETEAVATAFGPRLRLFHQGRNGPGAARNFGCQQAIGEYLIFLDSDDLWFPWTLSTFREVLDREQRPSFVMGCALEFIRIETFQAVKHEPLRYAHFNDYLSSSNTAAWVPGCCMAIRRKDYEKVGGFTHECIGGEDSDLALRLGAETGFVCIAAPYTVGYREHATNTIKLFDRCVEGVRFQIRSELAGIYPGGEERKRARWQILTRHVRPVSVACLSRGMRREAWQLYRASFNWHLAVKRWKYLIGFPLKALLS